MRSCFGCLGAICLGVATAIAGMLWGGWFLFWMFVIAAVFTIIGTAMLELRGE